jgi:Rieske Fe-S protein
VIEPQPAVPHDPRECTCPLAERRAFLRDVSALVASLFAAMGASPARAATLTIRLARGVAGRGTEQGYPIPPADGATIDKDNQVILVRFQQKAYAFNLSCPHQNTALRWNVDEGQFQCPKHHSKYQPTGEFISGRATRNMDRLGIRRDGQNLIVDVEKFYRQDKNPTEWATAFVTLS